MAKSGSKANAKRKHVEERDSEDRFRILADDAPVLIWVTGPDGSEFVNLAYLEFVGVSREEDVQHFDWAQYVHPDDRERYLNTYLDCFRRQVPFNAVLRFRRHDGVYRWMKSIGKPRYTSSGEFYGYVGSTQDITDVKLLEGELLKARNNLEAEVEQRTRELRESEEKFVLALKNSGTVLFHQDQDLRYQWAYNPHPGFSNVEYLGKTDTDLLPPDDASKLVAIKKQVLETGVGKREEVRTTIGGVSYYYDLTVEPLLDPQGKTVGIMGASHDITERKRAEGERERLLKVVDEQRGRLQAILNALPVGVFIADASGKIVQSNDLVRKIWGGDTPLSNNIDEYAEYKGWWADTGKPIKAEEWGLARAISNGETSLGEVVDIQRFDGMHGTMLNSAAPVKDARGNIIGGVVIIQDITQRRHLEKDLKDAKEQAELYLDLMGHDINNMHQIALGYLEMAREMGPERRESEFLDKPIEVLQRSARLIQNVRKLQKLHDRVFQSQDIDVCGTLVDVQREFGAVPHKAITLNLNGCERCRVLANELLHDVFANLVSNAIKHTGDRADITVSLDVVESDSNPHCRVSVEDNGPGIPDDFKGVIFNRVLKGTNKAKGMGLGLYLVKSLVESYGGRVWVEDRVKGDHTQGARFVVMLPAFENVKL